MFIRRILALGALVFHALAPAQDYPSRPITLVVPYPAGGGTDVVARALAEQMAKRLGQPVVVDNKPGASGILGTQAVAKAAPDGHTVLVTLTQSVITNQFLYQKLPYDARKEFAFITEVASGPLVLVVHPSVPAQNAREFLAWAARNKGKVNYGSWGAGSYPHLAGSHMSKAGQLDLSHIAYKGEAPMVQDLVGGQLSFTIGGVTTLKPFIESGKLRALAITGDQRISALPDVPTFAEAGLSDPEYKVLGWVGLMAPAGTPASVLARLQQEAQAAIRSPALQARFAALGMVPIGNSAEQFRRQVEQDLPVWERLVRVSGAKLD